MSNKGKHLKSVTDKNGVQTRRWVREDSEKPPNAEALDQTSTPSPTVKSDPLTGNVPLFSQRELDEVETDDEPASGPPVFEPRGAGEEKPPDPRGGPPVYGPKPTTPVFKPRAEGEAKPPNPRGGPPVYGLDDRVDRAVRGSGASQSAVGSSADAPQTYRTPNDAPEPEKKRGLIGRMFGRGR